MESGVYQENCDSSTMSYYPFFMKKLLNIQKYCQRKTIKSQKYYQLGNIIWSNKLLKKDGSYPSDYFVKCILATSTFNGGIVNPPLEIPTDKIPSFHYIPLHYNKLLIIDALVKQGSSRRYQHNDRFIYSEHSGVISIKYKTVDKIIVSTEKNRIDNQDDDIYLPTNITDFKKYEYLFHTHPNTDVYGGRIKEGIIYEFPSANDILNFVKYHNEGIAQSSIIATPEGIYVIRPIKYCQQIYIAKDFHHQLQDSILEWEKMAIKRFKYLFPKISDPKVFHQNVGNDRYFINLYNQFIKSTNLLVEYYPRIFKNNEWHLPQIYLQYLEIEQD